MQSVVLRSVAATLVVASIAACTDTPTVTPATAPAAVAAVAAPLGTDLTGGAMPSSVAGQKIPGQYIVLFRDGTPDPRALASRLVAEHGGELLHVYTHAVQGFAARLDASAVDVLLRHQDVELVEQDMLDALLPVAADTGVTPQVALDDAPQGITTQTGATWGIDRIDQDNLPLNGRYVYRATGEGVNVYIIDSGIRFTHREFEGRAVLGVDLVPNENRNGLDCTGHGSHVAGTVGGKTYGVAKQATLIAVRTFGCPDATGSASSPRSRTIAAVDWVTANHVKPAVVNMSLGGNNESFPGLSTLDRAVENGVARGIVFAVAAGNDNGLDACTRSPARAPNALTVGSSARDDMRSYFSNSGSCVDLYAPGSSITSAHWQNDTDARTISGTSMATPHVAGVAALFLQAHPAASPAAVSAAIVGGATRDRIVANLPNTVNLLLHALRPGNRAPVAAFAMPAGQPEGTMYVFDGGASTDVDGDPLTYRWSIQGTERTTRATSQGYPDNGTFTATLTVTDIVGATSTLTQSFDIANAAPMPALSLDAGTILSGETATATARFSDAGLNDTPWTWTLNWQHGAPQQGTAATQGGTFGGSRTFLRAGSYTVGATVVDKDGGAGTATALLVVRPRPAGVDVKPGSTDNPLSLTQSTSAKVPAAILGSANLNVRELVAGSAMLGDTRVAAKRTGAYMASYEDVNGDGFVDAVFHFERQRMLDDGTLGAATTSLLLTVELPSGVQVGGEDRVRVSP